MGIESSLIFALLAMLCWGFGDFLIQRSARRVGDLEALAFIGLVGTIILLPFIIHEFHLIYSYQNLLLLLLLGIISFVGAMINFEALKKGKLSIIDVLFELELPITIILAFIFFRESLSYTQLFIVFFIFIGLILMATKSFSHWKVRLEKGVLLAIIAAIGMGLINFLTATSSRQISPLMAVWAPWFIFTLLCFIFILRRKKGFSKFLNDGLKFKSLLIFMSLFDTIAWIFYSFATNNGDISVITAITEGYPAIAVLLGLWINKEKINWHQYAGIIITLIATFVLVSIV
jgi:drug/metabolite transporter (DMT)-like permease